MLTTSLSFLFRSDDDKREVFTCGDYQYSLLKDGSAMITRCKCHCDHIIIPNDLNGIPVTRIGTNVFGEHSPESINIPDGVTTIDNYAFSGCHRLRIVIIPDSVVFLGNNPFVRCARLEKIRISSNHPVLEVINGVLFDKTTKKLICYPCGLLFHDYYTIPQGIRRIGDSAFYNNEHIRRVIIPNSVISLEGNPFAESHLKSIYVPPDHPTLSVIDDVLFEKATKKLICCPGGKSGAYTVPQGIQQIGDSAFYGCHLLTDITLPDSVTSIGNLAFQGCGHLNNLVFPDSVMTIGDRVFINCESLTTLSIPDSVTSIGKDMFSHYSMTVTVKKNSYAHHYCKENIIPYTCPGDFNLDWLNH